MKFWEAMKALEEGKKVRCLRWSCSGYIENTRMFNYSEYEWELFCDPVKTYTFMEAIQLMKEGNKMRRPNYREDSSIFANKIGRIKWSNGDRFPIDIADIEANDWIAVE